MGRKMNVNENGGELDASKLALAEGIDESALQQAVAQAVEELLAKFDLEEHCEVDVSMHGKWCTLEGTVDSQEMRIALFDIVPVLDGKRYIVDRLHVTYDTEHSQEL